jgi:hypothetical protein
MAKFNEILVGRFNRCLQKLLSMKGPASMSQLAAELQPVFAFSNGVENRYLEGWDRYGVWQQIPGGAAVTSVIQLRNPASSNVIAVIEKISVVSTLADTPRLQHGPQTADLTTVDVGSNTRWDARGRKDPTCIFSRQTGAGGPPTNKAQLGLAALTGGDFIVTDIQEIPLLPGDAASVTTTALNDTLAVTWWWRERFLEDSERT